MTLVAYALVFVVALFGALELALRLLQLGNALKQAPSQPDASPGGRDRSLGSFVSVHIATCNEPPSLVIATLEALANSRFADFEVIIIDNNTTNCHVWAPVQVAAARLGEQFRFMHFDRLEGAKAGALNVALALTNPRTTHVAVVDADYVVDVDFLQDAVSSLTTTSVDYVQFPQAYRGVGRAARGVEQELGDYFACFFGGAGRSGSMLPTGTLSLFTAQALRAVGGWPTETITEDAEIGVRLQAAGCKGVWLARERGHGLLRVDFRGLRSQRARWAAGNLQVLKRLHRFDWVKLRVGDLVNLVVQLTAWISLLLPAALALLLVGVVGRFPFSGVIAGMAAATILASAAATALRISILSGDGVDWRVRLEACAAKTALTWTSALAWIPALWPRPLRFHRTSKAIEAMADRREPMLAAASLAFFAIGVNYGRLGDLPEAGACLLLASIWLCARSVDGALRRAAAMNPELR